MHNTDVQLFHWINGWSNAYAPFYDGLSEGNKMWPARIALLVLAIILIAAGPQTRKAAIFAILGVLLANGLCDLLKHTFPVLRPCVELPGVINHGVGFLGSAGTASAHAANTAAIAVVFTYYLRWWGVIPILLSFFTGLARIYVGVHYPSQVLFGWLCGVAVGGVLIMICREIQKRKKPKSAAETADEQA